MIVIIIDILLRFLVIIVIVDVVLSYVISPYHPVREALDRIVEPLLLPIRRFVPPIQNIDFTPLVFIILVQIIRAVLVSVAG